MMTKLISCCCAILFCVVAFWTAEAANVKGEESIPYKVDGGGGQALFKQHCAQCHESNVSSAPSRFALRLLSASTIYDALTTGRMRGQAANLPDPERRQISEYLSGKAMREPHGSPHKLCIASGKWFDKSKRPVGNGWGIDYENTRLIPAQQAGFAAADAKNLRLKWAFAFPGVSSVLAQPLVAGGAVFIGSQDGTVYALDAQSGCLHWTLKAAASILGSIVMEEKESGSPRLYFSDRLAYAYAVDAIAGVLVWSKKIDDHPSATTMGTPVLAAGRLFVPIISLEENAGGAEYSCCTFRGSLIALDAATGDKIWQRYAIPSPAVEQFKNALGVPQFAPSGAGLWSSPAIDGKRGSIYFATGNSYSEPADENSNAVFAIDLESGDVKWRIQTLSDDSWTSWDYACRKNSGGKSLPGCPAIKNPGPDLDFTTSPVLVYGKNGKDILVVGRKDGTVFGLDPNSGWIVWSKRTSKNPDPNAGALYFGLMAEGERIFVPSVGTSFPNGGDFIPTADDGLYALHAFTGKRLWAARVTENCDKPTPCTGLSFAPIGIPGAVFAGATDGYVRAYDTKTGKVLWRFDTAQQFQTINGEMATGGAIGRSSIMVANRTVYVGSGYSKLPGNVLLAFSID